MYVNGVAATTTTVTGSIQTSTLPLRIGGNTIWGEYFQGQIDELRVYDRTLTQAEILTDMATAIGVTGGGGGGGTDTTAPVVSVTAPAAGSTVTGTSTLTATASDNVGVVGVQFKVDGVNVGAEDTTSPYSLSWNSATANAGAHQITAIARDVAGNTSTSAPIGITVALADTQAPTVAISAPATGATIAGTSTLTAAASDNVGVVGVQFRLDGANVGAEDTTSPYSLSWNSTTVPNGTHSLTAVARDQAGNTTTSGAVAVTVNNADTTPPTIIFSSPANGATVSGTVTVSATCLRQCRCCRRAVQTGWQQPRRRRSHLSLFHILDYHKHDEWQSYADRRSP